MTSRKSQNLRAIMSFASLARYREKTMRIICRHFGEDLLIYAGTPPVDPTIRVIDSEAIPIESVRNTYLPNDVLLQNIPFRRFLQTEVLLLDLNPRIPHVWALLILRRLLGRRTVLWGHAWPRQGRDSRSEILRRIMRNLASALVTYTRTQARELRELHPRKPIYAAPNALFHRHECYFKRNSVRSSYVYVGRLHPSKKPELLLSAFALLAQRDENAKLEFVGDGEMASTLTEQARSMGLEDRVVFHGHNDDYDELRMLYSRAVASISPGYAGLSVTQSLSFGVPIIVSEDEHHAPEIEALIPGWNSEYFQTDDAQDLADKMWAAQHEAGHFADGADIASDCADKYSVETMAHGIIQALENAQPR